MRILIVLLLTGALAWAFLKLFPSQGVHGAGEGSHASKGSGPGGGPASGPAPSEPIPGAAAPSAAPAPAPAAVAKTAPPGPPAGGADVIEPDQVEVGRLLAYGAASALRAGIESSRLSLGAARRELVMAFLEALAGQREAALTRMQGAGLRSGVSERELALLRAAVEDGDVSEVAATMSPIERGLASALFAIRAEAALRAGQHAAAARAYSRLLLAQIAAPWPREPDRLRAWSEALEAAQARHRWNRRGDWPSFDVTVMPGDSLVQVRLRALELRPELGLHLSTGLIARANEVRGDVIHPGDVLRIPTDPVSVEVDVGARWMYYLHGAEVVAAWEVGVGREGEETITGEFVVGLKQKQPTWWPRGRSPVPFGDPENPLGTRWIAWRLPGESKDTSYGFHGTKEPESIGKAASEGCIRMWNERVEELFEILPVGASVRVR